MAVALRGYTQGTFDSDGNQSIAWPAGTAAGDLAVVMCATGKDKKPTTKLPAGWRMAKAKSGGESLWWKIVTIADVASPLLVTARVALLQTLSGASGIGSVGSGEGVTVLAGGGLLLSGWKTTGDTLTVSNKIHATDVVNESYVVKGTSRVFNTWFTPAVTAGYYRIDTNASYFFALVVHPRLTPYAPTPLAPADGSYANYGTGWSVALQSRHNSLAGGAFEALSTRLRVVGSPTWLYVALNTGDDYVLTSTPTTISFGWYTQPLVTLRTGLLTNNSTYEWQMSTGEGAAMSPFSASSAFSLRTAPSAVVSVVAPAGDLTPTVNWTETLTNGTQTAYQVQVEVATDLGLILSDFDIFATLGELDPFTLGDLDSL